MGNFVELEERYHLIYNCKDGASVLSRVRELLRSSDLKAEWARRREPLLQGKMDLTAFMVWFVENYPGSFAETKEHPEVQYTGASVLGGIVIALFTELFCELLSIYPYWSSSQKDLGTFVTP